MTGDEALRSAVLRRLVELDEAAGSADARTLLPLARTEITRLADGWRLLLAVHEPDGDGRCPACPAVSWSGRRRWPCPVWRLAQEHLVGDGGGARRLRRRRTRRVEPGVLRSPSGEVLAHLHPARRGG
ncbi:hypothetical protein [Actinokineospora bangkokensis]|uniref:Uncharacterized protein n=1 Tax=Actinokineospora bangkokensis TaxID=1193682 RepID=A0A1Q9LEE4_9PSEU|nr:hypothetical protein [Actinokineospora bangkokensis]OLR90373.1 hypothetical protein BJP25_27325 [Actinokineospora bangkokensis]